MGFDQLSGKRRRFRYVNLTQHLQVDPQTRPSNIGPPFTGHFKIIADTPRGLQPFQPGSNTVTTPGKPHPSTDRALSATPAAKSDLNLELRRNVYDDKGKEIKAGDDASKQANGESSTANGSSEEAGATKAMDQAAKEPKKTVNCYSCGIDCTRLRFHYAKTDPATASSNPNEVKYDLCSNCYYQSRMPSTHRSSDFVKMEEPSYTTIPDKDAPWTDTETLLLLEGLENFDTDWESVANHVGTRTKEECVMKFLQLEIQDQYMEDGPGNNASSSLRLLGGVGGGREPISQLENPVMSVVSFLAQMAEPSVVAAASGRSIKQIHTELQSNIEKGIGGAPANENAGKSDKEKEATDDIKPESDSMEVDAAPQDSGSKASDSTNQPHLVTDIATLGLTLAGSRASALASSEERHLTQLVGAAVNLTLQKFELKLAQFAEMEEIVQAERRELERGRQQLFLDRLAFKKRMREMENAMRAASLKGGEEGLRLMQGAMANGMSKGGFGFQSQQQGQAPGQINGVTPLSQGSDEIDFKSVDI